MKVACGASPGARRRQWLPAVLFLRAVRRVRHEFAHGLSAADGLGGCFLDGQDDLAAQGATQKFHDGTPFSLSLVLEIGNEIR